MLVHIDCQLRESTNRRVVVPTGTTLQQLLSNVLDVAFDDLIVRINNRSASRLTPLLPGDRIEVRERD